MLSVGFLWIIQVRLKVFNKHRWISITVSYQYIRSDIIAGWLLIFYPGSSAVWRHSKSSKPLSPVWSDRRVGKQSLNFCSCTAFYPRYFSSLAGHMDMSLDPWELDYHEKMPCQYFDIINCVNWDWPLPLILLTVQLLLNATTTTACSTPSIWA